MPPVPCLSETSVSQPPPFLTNVHFSQGSGSPMGCTPPSPTCPPGWDCALPSARPSGQGVLTELYILLFVLQNTRLYKMSRSKIKVQIRFFKLLPRWLLEDAGCSPRTAQHRGGGRMGRGRRAPVSNPSWRRQLSTSVSLGFLTCTVGHQQTLPPGLVKG